MTVMGQAVKTGSKAPTKQERLPSIEKKGSAAKHHKKHQGKADAGAKARSD